MGRNVFGVYSVIGILINIGFIVSNYMLGLIGTDKDKIVQFLEVTRTGVWTIVTIPLVFLIFNDVKKKKYS